jgi:hypothetical protein
MILRAVLTVVLALSAVAADAQQQGRKQEGARQMSHEDRQRMREDMRDAYRQRQDRPQKARQQQMSPEQRSRLRRDIEDANKNLKR